MSKGMDFGEALDLLRSGRRVARADWINGFLVLVPGSEFVVTADRPMGKALPKSVGERVSYLPHIDFCTHGPGIENTLEVWFPTQTDILAGDWRVLL